MFFSYLKHSFCLLFIFIGFKFINAQELKNYNKALIWRGFNHSWTYNHRVNRLGNYVSFKNGIGTTTHASATGLGSDSTFSNTYYTYVESPDVFFKETEIKIFITGKEGDLQTKKEKIYLDLEKYMSNKDNYSVILNGFEIKSIEKADQLHLFRFMVEDPVYNEQTNQLLLTGIFNLVTNCRTLECNLFKNNTAYELTIKLLVMAYNSNKANLSSTLATKNYVWDTKIEVKDEAKNLNLNGEKDKFSNACIGIKGLSFILDEEHWLLEMNAYAMPKKYNAKTGVLDADMHIKFVEWKNEMNAFSVSPFQSTFAKRKEGYALLDMSLYNIQFAKAKIIHGNQKTTSFWKGRNNNADSKGAYKEIDITQKLKFN